MLPNKPSDTPVNKLYNPKGFTDQPAYGQQPQQDPAAQQANYEKLNPTERAIYGALPSVASSPIAKVLSSFGDSWMGKTLSVFDVGAEGIERTLGTAFQFGQHLADSPQAQFDWSSAWYASSLFYDTANLPMLKYQRNPNAGKPIPGFGPGSKQMDYNIVGIQMPSDLPGMAGLANMRKKLSDYVSAGMNPHDALIKTRDEYYNGLGALALRSQLQDTYGHMFLDPAAWLMPEIKPVERLQAIRYLATTSKFAGTAEEALKGAEDLTLLSKAATSAEEAASLATKAEHLTGLAAQIQKVDEVTKLAEDARAAGHWLEAVKYSNQAAKLRKDAGLITSFDKFAIFATGGNLFEGPSAAYSKLRSTPVVGWLMKPFELTPESKAKELMNLMADNYGAKIFASIDRTDPHWVDKLQATIERISAGSTGPEFGHGLLTIEGRTAQAYSHGVSAVTGDVFDAYRAIWQERTILGKLAEATSFSPTELIDMAAKDKAALMKLVTEKATPEIAALIQAGKLTPDSLEAIGAMVKNLPYTDELLQAHLMDQIETFAMRQAVTQFGVKERGLITRWSSAMKSAETLAFMRLNPAYAIRNVVNNDVTMIARGVFGMMSAEEIDAFWKTAGFVPKRLEEAFSAGSSIEKGATSVLQDALKGKAYGAPEKIQNFFRDIRLGKLDVASWSRDMEQAASKQAFTSGYMQFYREFVKPEILTHIDQATLSKIPKDVQDALVHAERSAMGRNEILDSLLGSNLNVTPSAVLDATSKKLGMDVSEMLGPEATTYLSEHLAEAYRTGKLDELGQTVRQMSRAHVEDLFKKAAPDLADAVKQQFIAGGPQTWYKSLGDTHIMWLDGELEHAQKIGPLMDAVEAARTEKDWAAVNGLWQKIMGDDEQHFLDLQGRMNTVFDALDQGHAAIKADAKARGLVFDLPEVTPIRQSFNETRGLWKDYFAERKQMLSEFFGAKLKGEEYSRTFEQVQTYLDTRYKDVFKKENILAQQADDAVAQMIPDTMKRQAFMNYRDQVQQLQNLDRQAVIDLRKTLRDTTRDQRPALWNKFWQERQVRLNQVKYIESAGTALMQEDPKALQMFTTKQSFMETIDAVGNERKATALEQELQKATAAGETDRVAYLQKQIDFYRQEANKSKEVASIYDLANQFGISSASDAGVPNDRRILNTVNKYAPRDPNARPINAGINSDKYTKVPRHELPKPVSDTMEQYARMMLDEMHSGEAGKRTRLTGGVEGQLLPGFRSSNVQWYKDAFREGYDKKTLDAAFQRILDDAGKDKGKAVEFAKGLIYDRIGSGDPQMGDIPNMLALWQMGASDKELLTVLEHSNAMSHRDLTLAEAFAESGFSEQDAQKFADEVVAGVYTGRSQQPGAYTHIKDIPLDVARKAFEADANARAASIANAADKTLVSKQFVADVKKVVPDTMPLDLITEQATYGRLNTAVDAVMESAKTQARKSATLLKDLPQDVQAEVMKAVDLTKSGFADSRLAATRYGEFRRDAALLNYNRRTNADSWISNMFPYVFWTTGSLQKWAIENIDRPAMFTNYLRMKKLLETAGAPENGFPSRLKDNIRIKLPFAPSWMGDQYIDPLRMALPFDSFAQPIEQWQQNQTTLQGRAERVLQQNLQDGKISQQEYQDAITSHSGPKWDWAVSQAQANDDSLKFDAWDFATTMASPHAPVMWAYQAATGHPENIGPITPETRMIRNAFTAMGVPDWNNSQYNIEAKIRKTIGLPAYDNWDGYRAQREISNLVTEGKYTVEDAKRAMIIADQDAAGQIPHDQAMQNPLYAEAVKRANQEYTGGPGGFLMSLIGLNVKSYPEGEQQLRQLNDQFGKAYALDQAAGKKLDQFTAQHPDLSQAEVAQLFAKMYPQDAKNASALTDFFNAHPEYETRLGLFDKPEVRLQKFTVDQVWKQYNSLPTVTKKEMAAQLGPQFKDSFLNSDTRSYSSIPIEQMSVWLKIMGGNPPGVMTADQTMLANLFQGQLKLTAPETAWRAEVFYDTRKNTYPNALDLQTQYYKQPAGAKQQAFLRANPELQQYWNFRRDFMTKNPDLVPYLTDVQSQIDKAKRQVRRPNVAVPTALEISNKLSPSMDRIVSSYAASGDPLPPATEAYLSELGKQYNLTPDEILNIMSGKMTGAAQPVP